MAVSVARAFLDGPKFIFAWKDRTPSDLWLVSDCKFINTTYSFYVPLFLSTYWLCCFCSYLFPNCEFLESEDWV